MEFVVIKQEKYRSWRVHNPDAGARTPREFLDCPRRSSGEARCMKTLSSPASALVLAIHGIPSSASRPPILLRHDDV